MNYWNTIIHDNCKDKNSNTMYKHCARVLKCDCKDYKCKDCKSWYVCKCKLNNGYPCEYCQFKFQNKENKFKRCKCKICNFDKRS